MSPRRPRIPRSLSTSRAPRACAHSSASKGRELARALLLLIAGSICPAADARSTDQRPRLNAHALRASGLRQLRSGQLSAAARSLEEAYRLLPDADGLYLLCGLARMEGRVTAARDLARRYLAETDRDPEQEPQTAGPLEPGRDQSRAEARRILEQLDGPSGELSLLGPTGAWVILDDRLIGRLPLARPLWVPAGAHQVAVDRGPELSLIRARVEVGAGRQLELRVQPDTDSLLVTRMPAMVVLFGRDPRAAAAEPRLLQAIAAAAQREHLFMVSVPSATEPSAQPGSCAEPGECMQALAERADAAYVLEARVDGPQPPQEAGDWQLELRLLSAVTGELATSRTLRCSACAAARAAELLQTELTDALALASARPRGELVVQTEPTGAAVYSAGQRLGTTPYRRAAWTGGKQLELRRDGYSTWTGRVEIEEARRTTLSLRLQPVPEPPARIAGIVHGQALTPASTAAPAPEPRAPERRRAARPRWRLITGGLSLAVGSLLVGFGASALALNGLCSPDTPPTASECRSTYDSVPVGGALLSIGAAALAAGSVLLIVPGRSQERGPKYPSP